MVSHSSPSLSSFFFILFSFSYSYWIISNILFEFADFSACFDVPLKCSVEFFHSGIIFLSFKISICFYTFIFSISLLNLLCSHIVFLI